MRRLGLLLVLFASSCGIGAPPAAAPTHSSPAPWPAAIFDSQGNPRLEFVEPDTPGAVRLLPRHAEQATPCILNGVEWKLRQNHRGLVSQDAAQRHIPLPAYPFHNLACNGRYIALDASVGTAPAMWVIDSVTGKVQETRLPASRRGYGAVFPVLNPEGELAYAIAASYSGVILVVQGEGIALLPGGALVIASTVDITQFGDSVLVQTDFTYVLSAADKRVLGSLELGQPVWVRPSDAGRAPPQLGAAQFHDPWHSEQESEMASPSALFDGNDASESLLPPGRRGFVLRLVRPVLDPKVRIVLNAAGVTTIVAALATSYPHGSIPVLSSGGEAFPRDEPASEPKTKVPNLHHAVSEVTISLTCACQGNPAECDGLCRVGEIAVE